MNINLDKEDLISLVKGSLPYYTIMDELKKYGSFDNYKGWNWNNYELVKCTEEKLLNIYYICKNSWK